MGEGPNTALFYPIRLYMIFGRRGGGGWSGCRILNYLPFSPPPPTTLLKGTALNYFLPSYFPEIHHNCADYNAQIMF